ncbi:MAG: hypothetical protein KDA58_15215, partial [Planctomycetaceae bacterium]|nr:hypothetical protein [Planctomycetaceae bacterium]
PPPADWNLNPVYTQAVMVDDFPVIASAKVHPAALREAAFLIHNMLRHRPDVLRELAKRRVRFVVMGYQEYTTDVPEHSDLTPAKYWNRRARGLGASKERPAVSCGEENLLCYPGDPYPKENILVHEFAHAIDEMALRQLSPDFAARLQATYTQARDDGLWKDAYAMTNPQEYWAEGVQSYFGTNRENDAVHNHVNTRAELEEYDPRLFELIDHEFRQNPWTYQRPPDREPAGRAHLGDYDAAKAPTFAWPVDIKDVDLNDDQ